MPLVAKRPNCRTETPWENNPHRPFCSDRCQRIDLGAWTEERYKVRGDAVDSLVNDQDDGDDDAR